MGCRTDKKSIDINSQIAKAHNHLSNCLSTLNRNTEALTSFDNAISHQPSNPENYFKRAFILGLLERPEDAVVG